MKPLIMEDNSETFPKNCIQKQIENQREGYHFAPVFVVGNRGVAYLQDSFVILIDRDYSIFINNGLIHDSFDKFDRTKVLELLLSELQSGRSLQIHFKDIIDKTLQVD